MGEPAMAPKAPTTHVLEAAFKDLKDLVRLEFDLAKNELQREKQAAVRSLIAFGVCLVLLSSGVAVLAITAVWAFSSRSVAALGLGLALLAGSAVAWILGARAWPKSLLGQTERRIEKDIEQLEEHLS